MPMSLSMFSRVLCRISPESPLCNVGVYLLLILSKILTFFYLCPHCSLRFNLKTRWITKSDQKTVFDSLYLYLCGLASPHCTPVLVQLARTAGGQSWVLKRQALVLKLLNKLCHSNTLTGPKVKYELERLL